MAHGLTLKAAARMIGVSPAAYGETERNRNGANDQIRALMREWIGEEREAELYAELVERRAAEKAEARGKRRNKNLKNPPLEKRGKTFCVVTEGRDCPKDDCCAYCKDREDCMEACLNSPDVCGCTYRNL